MYIASTLCVQRIILAGFCVFAHAQTCFDRLLLKLKNVVYQPRLCKILCTFCIAVALCNIFVAYIGDAILHVFVSFIQVLDEESEVFVVKMWRLLIYETEAKNLGLVK